MVTRRAVLVVVVGFCFYLIALVNTLPGYYYSLTWLSASMLASSLAIALLSLMGLECQWDAARALVAEAVPEGASGVVNPSFRPPESGSGDATMIDAADAVGAAVELRLQNRGTLNKTGVRIDILLKQLNRSRPVVRRFLLEALPSGSSVETTIVLQDLPRGRYDVSEIRLIGSDALGLFRVQKRIRPALPAAAPQVTDEPAQTPPPQGQDALIVVGPAMVTTTSAAASPVVAGALHGGNQALHTIGQGEELRGIRSYEAGDDLRNVHWRSTARLGKLVVKEFEQMAHGCSLVIWDGAVIRGGNPASEALAAEWGLRLTASLCRTFIETAQPCMLLRLDSHPLSVPDEGLSRRQGHAPVLAQVMEALADADAARESPLSEPLRRYLPVLPEGSRVFLVSASLDAELIRCVTRCCTAGARVVVGLVDPSAGTGAGREAAVSPPAPASASEAQDRRSARDSALQAPRRRRSMSLSEAAEQQTRLLHEAGARVITLEPLGRASLAAALAPLESALREMLGLEETAA